MSDAPGSDARKDSAAEFSRRIGAKELRKVQAQRKSTRSVWFGFAMFGLIGWSVVVPTLLGAGVGWWLDRHSTDQRSWTLALLIAGLVLGCANAWHWVIRENRAMHTDEEPHAVDRAGPAKEGEKHDT